MKLSLRSSLAAALIVLGGVYAYAASGCHVIKKSLCPATAAGIT